MITRAKFKCESVMPMNDGSESITWRAVYEGEENKFWSRWTPSGQLIMTISNPALEGKFKVGKEYYLDITEVGR